MSLVYASNHLAFPDLDTLGSHYPIIPEITSNGVEDRPSNNTATLQVMAVKQIFLLLGLRQWIQDRKSLL